MNLRIVAVILVVACIIKVQFLLHEFPSFTPDYLVRKVQYVLPMTESQLTRRVKYIIDEQPGSYAVYEKLVYPPINNRPLSLWSDTQFSGASLAKLYIVATAFDEFDKGKLTLSQPVTISKEMQDTGGYGTGILRFRLGFTNPYTNISYTPETLYSSNPDDPMVLSLGDLLYLSIRYSDNVAILGVAQTVGRETAQRYIERLGLKNSSILSYNDKGEVVRPNLTSVRDIGVFLEKLYKKQIIPQYADKMLSWLFQTEESDRIVYPLPPSVRVLHKTGESSEDGIYHDAAIVITPQGTAYILVVMSLQPQGTSGEFAQTQISVIRAVSRLMYNHILASEQLFFLPQFPGIRQLLHKFSI